MQMGSFRPQCYFQDLNFRELNGFIGRKRPYIDDISLNFSEIGAISVEHNGEKIQPLASSFCKTIKSSHILAISDFEGYVSLYDTRKKIPSFGTYDGSAEKARIYDWVAHDNAVFDVCWAKEDTRILTASGDQTVKVWDVEGAKCIGVLMGHIGSVKSICIHPVNPEVIVSGSRDGSFALWDLRCKYTSRTRPGVPRIFSTSVVERAHLSPQAKKHKRDKSASTSITSVLYLKDEVSIATAGAADSVVKFWDTRNLKAQVTQTCPCPEPSTEKEGKLHGIASLSQDLNGTFLSASCMDNRIYLYNVLQLEKGPMKSFSGCRINSFFVKSAISPDASHILSGSTDGNAYIWQVNNPLLDPIVLKSHDREVTSVDWCTSEFGKIATSSDDFTVRIWNIRNNSDTITRSPSSLRRRVMANPRMKCKRLFTDEGSVKNPSSPLPSGELLHNMNSPKVTTPECQKKIFFSSFDLKEAIVKTPEATLKSPSSVLNPPSSLKRKTIRDYFAVPS